MESFHQSSDIQPILEVLRGPEASSVVAADKSTGGNSLLTVATIVDSAELLSLRLSLGGDAAEPMDFPNCQGNYLPHVAMTRKAPRCMAACLDAGADANARDLETGKTPLHYAAVCMKAVCREYMQDKYQGPSGKEREGEDVEAMLRELKSHGADVSLLDRMGNCPIVCAVVNHELGMAARLLKVFTSEPGSQHSKIRFAAIVNKVIAVEVTMRRVNFCLAPQMEAAQAEQFPTLLAALTRAWRPGGWDDSGRPGRHEPLQVAALAEAAVKRCAPRTLAWLCTTADAEAVRLGVRGQRAPLVHVALRAEGVEREVLGALLAALADLSLPDERGQNALHGALSLRCRDFTEQLLEHAPPEQLASLLTRRNSRGMTALGVCVADGLEPLALLLPACKRAGLPLGGLLERQAGHTGCQPTFRAVVEGHLGALQQLLAAGLHPESPACRDSVHPSEEAGRLDTSTLAEPGEGETLTLLMCAASMRKLPAVKLLLAAGADARCALAAGNRVLANAVTMVLRGQQMEALTQLAWPGREVAALAEPWLRYWQQEAVEGGCGARPPDAAKPPRALVQWLGEWGGAGGRASWEWDGDLGERFECLLLLLWHRAALTRPQVGELLVLLDASAQQGEASSAATALGTFLFKRLKPCSCCGLCGRWRRCACKRAWYCGRACQKQHWEAGHGRECPLAQQLRREHLAA